MCQEADSNFYQQYKEELISLDVGLRMEGLPA